MEGNEDDAGFKKLGVQHAVEDKLNGATPFWALCGTCRRLTWRPHRRGHEHLLHGKS